MRSERGQAMVEWVGLLLLVALALGGIAHLVSAADSKELGTSLAGSVTGAARVRALETRPAARRPPLRRVRPRAQRENQLPELPKSLRRAGRGAGALWKRAWFACLVYERTRYAFRHPESRFPGYTIPFGDALRMVNNCVSPIDVLGELPGPEGDR